MVWQLLDEQTSQDFLPPLNALEKLYQFKIDNTNISTLSLSFYPGSLLLKVTMMSWPVTEDALWYVKKPNGEIINLNGQIARIHQMNVDVPILLTNETITDYLKFRLFFELKHNQRSIVTENLAQFDHIRESDRNTIQEQLHPVTATQENGQYNVSYCYHYKDRIFDAKATIDGNGLLTEVTKDELPYSIKLQKAPDFISA